MSNPNPSPDLFERLARGMRAAYAHVATSVDDVKRMDGIERASAEMTTYALALATAADDHGLRPESVLRMVIDCVNDVRRLKGQPEIQVHQMRTPGGPAS